MNCWHCDRPSHAACFFCGRGVCKDHHRTMPGVLELFRDRGGTLRGLVVDAVMWCGICDPKRYPVNLDAVDPAPMPAEPEPPRPTEDRPPMDALPADEDPEPSPATPPSPVVGIRPSIASMDRAALPSSAAAELDRTRTFAEEEAIRGTAGGSPDSPDQAPPTGGEPPRSEPAHRELPPTE